MTKSARETKELKTMSLISQLSSVFSPSAPIDKQALFAGRTSQLRDVLTSINQRGQHVIIYGERGVGKTSLASTLSEICEAAGLQIIQSGTINCDGTDNFSSLWKKVFREMTFKVKHNNIGFTGQTKEDTVSLENLLNANLQSDEVTPDDVRYTLQKLGKSTIIIDEVDRLRKQETTTLLADTIKTLSDHSTKTTLILVGVADSVDQLIAEHKSVERAMAQIHMPRMLPEELHEILEKGLAAVRMSIDRPSKHRIAWLSRGLPHYTHLLGLHASIHAVEDGRTAVTVKDVDAAIQPAVSKAQQSIIKAYHSAVSSPRKDNLYAEVLLACALAPADTLGYFAASDVRAPLSEIMGKAYNIPAFSRHLNDFCLPHRGSVLQKTGSVRKFRFRFTNPLLQPFVVIDGMAKQLVSNNLIQSTQLSGLVAANRPQRRHGT